MAKNKPVKKNVKTATVKSATVKKTVAKKPVPKNVAPAKAVKPAKTVTKKVVVKKTVQKKTTTTTKPVQQKRTVKNLVASRSRAVLWGGAVLLLVALCIGFAAFTPCNKNQKKFVLVDRDGRNSIDLYLEIADQDEERLQGLMGRENIPEKTGMLFDFEEPGDYSMWMKDTVLPLDMIFMNELGQVTALAEDRTPMTEDLINPCSVKFEEELKKNPKVDVDKFYDKCEKEFADPNKMTRFVIEVPAGTIRNNNIRENAVLFRDKGSRLVSIRE